MTERAKQHLQRLRGRPEVQRARGCEETSVDLRQRGLDPVEVGWIVHHLFGRSMGEAVHLATVCDWNLVEFDVAASYDMPSPPRVISARGKHLSAERRERRELARTG